MCFFCCVTLRGASYFMVTVHMVGTFVMSLIAIEFFMFPPNYPDINLSPLIMSQLPLIVAAYSMMASFFACFIFRAIDTDSISLLKWSTIGFGVYQSLILLVQLVFSIMFGDILTTSGQAFVVCGLSLLFLITLAYLLTLFLYGKQLYGLKYPKLYRNSFNPQENNWGITSFPSSIYTKEHQSIPGLNLLQNHPSVSRTSSDGMALTLTSTTGTNTDESPPQTLSQV